MPEEKRQIIFALGSDPILTDGRLTLKEHFWLQPIRKNKSTLTDKAEQVRTSSEQRKKASFEALYTTWCGYRESNPALILGKDT